MTLREAMTMKDLDVGLGHCYFDIINNEQRIEFHIDYWNRAVASTARPVEIKATTSIQVSSKARPIMIVGQDESVFAQYLRYPYSRRLKGMATCCRRLFRESLNLADC